MHFVDNGFFKTSDTSLASFLMMRGYKMTRIELSSDGQGLFLFEESQEMLDLVDPFYRGDLYRYFRIYKNLLKKVKNERIEP